MTESEFIKESIGKPELLCQLAEECAELSQAALKLRRVITGENPTPVTHEEAVAALIEEFADVTLCAKMIGCNEDDLEVRNIQYKKLKRWVKRLQRKWDYGEKQKEQKGDQHMERLTKRTYTISEPHDEMVTVVPGVNVTNIIERLAAYEDAEEHGLIVILPVKAGDTVYQLRDKKHALGVGVHPRHISCVCVYENDWIAEHQGDKPCTKNDFGKTWFLTREEAEAALAKEGLQCQSQKDRLSGVLNAPTAGLRTTSHIAKAMAGNG